MFLYLQYSRLKTEHAQYLSKHEKLTMNRDLGSLAVLFLSICQLYALRIYRATVYQLGLYHNEHLYEVVSTMPDICKAVMIIGICLSVYWRINIATDRHEYARSITKGPDDSLVSELIEDTLSSSTYSDNYPRKVNLTTN